MVANLNNRIGTVYRQLAKSQDVITLSYKAVVEVNNYESLLFKKLEDAFELDLLRGFTGYGPHREDVEIFINGKPPILVASRGEVRTLTIALKSIEAEVIEQSLEKKPIILLDDVFSELDKNRIEQLPLFLNNNQTIITTTDANIPIAYTKTIVL